MGLIVLVLLVPVIISTTLFLRQGHVCVLLSVLVAGVGFVFLFILCVAHYVLATLFIILKHTQLSLMIIMRGVVCVSVIVVIIIIRPYCVAFC